MLLCGGGVAVEIAVEVDSHSHPPRSQGLRVGPDASESDSGTLIRQLLCSALCSRFVPRIVKPLLRSQFVIPNREIDLCPDFK
jgi:hypothetical protein